MSSFSALGGNVSANGIRQHYIRYGSGNSPLVLVPGITSPAVTWGFVAERWADRFDVYVLDVRGRGLSSTGPSLDYDLDTMAADLVAFIEALDLHNVTVVGHSMGARIGLRAAIRNHSRFERLVLVDPPVSGPGRRPYPAKLDWYVDSIDQATDGMNGEDMRTFCPTWTEEQLVLRAEWLHTCYRPAIETAFEGFHNDDIFPDFAKLRVPTSLMIAGRGGVILQEDEGEIRKLNSGIAIDKVENAGHMIPWDDLEGFLLVFRTLVNTHVAEDRTQ